MRNLPGGYVGVLYEREDERFALRLWIRRVDRIKRQKVSDDTNDLLDEYVDTGLILPRRREDRRRN